MRKGLWSPDEDEKLKNCIATHLSGSWSDIARKAGLHRCGKSCRRRWLNHLRPDLKRGKFTQGEIRSVIKLHKHFGNKWSEIAAHLVGRTDNDVKNLWNTQIKRQLRLQQISDDAMISNALPSYYKSLRTTFPFSLHIVHNVEKLQQSPLYSHMSSPTHTETVIIGDHSWPPINSSSNGCLIKSTQLPILSEALLNTSLYNCFHERMSNASDKPTIYEFQKQQILHDHGMFDDHAIAIQLDLEHMDNLEEAKNVLPIELGTEDLSTTASEGSGEDTSCSSMGHPCYFDQNLYPIIAHGKDWSIDLTPCDDWHHETLLLAEYGPHLNVF